MIGVFMAQSVVFSLYEIIHADRNVSRTILRYPVVFLIFNDNSDGKFCDPKDYRCRLCGSGHISHEPDIK